MESSKQKPDTSLIYNRCMSGDAEFKISASDVGAAITSPFSLYCKYHGDPEKIDPPDPFLASLAVKGNEHEDAVLKSDYPEMETVQYNTNEDGFNMMISEMLDGASAISNFPMFYLPDSMHGYADILEKNEDAPSECGDYHYIVREIKSARNIKERHVLQAAFYNMMLGKIQEYTPEYFYITNIDKETSKYKYEEYENLLKEMITHVKDIQNGKIPPAIYGAGLHPWKNHCNDTAIEKNDISLISGIGPAKRELFVDVGFKTVKDVASTDIETLKKIKGIGEKTSVKYLRSACAITSGECIRNDNQTIELPKHKTEIFLDLEGLAESLDDTISDYLIGALVREDSTETYN